MILKKGSNRKISKNFTESEFFSKSPDAPEEHYMSDSTMAAGQILRDFTGVPVNVNSTFRTEKGNKAVGGGSKSQHLKGTASDYDMDQSALEKVKEDIRSKGPLFQKLRAAGINGFGIYRGFIHLDSRPPTGLHRDNLGSYAFWDKEIGTIEQKKKQ